MIPKEHQIFSNDKISAYVVAVGQIANNCGIVLNHADKTFFVIDAGQGLQTFLQKFIPEGYSITSVYVTHAHWDHIYDVRPLKEDGAKIYCHKNDKIVIENPDILIKFVGHNYGFLPTSVDATYNDLSVANEKDIDLHIRHVPGHNIGSLSYFIPSINAVFTGDTLFTGCIGRTDFYGGDKDLLVKNIKEKILTLPDNTIVVPGHGAYSTVKIERETNRYLL